MKWEPGKLGRVQRFFGVSEPELRSDEYPLLRGSAYVLKGWERPRVGPRNSPALLGKVLDLALKPVLIAWRILWSQPPHGELWLSSRRLLFTSGKAILPLEIGRSDMAAVGFSRYYWGYGGAGLMWGTFIVALRSGHEYRFQVQNGEDWVEEIEKLIGPAEDHSTE